MKWQPIETAPKDGTELLLVVAGFIPSTGRFETEFEKWMTISCEDFDDDDAWENAAINSDYSPTHWMHLPDVPNAVLSGKLPQTEL